MRKTGAEIRLGTEGTAALVHSLAPDGVIVATGAVPSHTGFSSFNPLADDLPGAGQENVLTVWDVLLETRPVGDRGVVLADDGGRYAPGVEGGVPRRGKQGGGVRPLHA